MLEMIRVYGRDMAFKLWEAFSLTAFFVAVFEELRMRSKLNRVIINGLMFGIAWPVLVPMVLISKSYKDVAGD